MIYLNVFFEHGLTTTVKWNWNGVKLQNTKLMDQEERHGNAVE